MNNISILTDTDSSIPPEIVEQLNLIQIPISIHFGEETFERICLVHVNALEQASEFEEQLREVFTLPKEISYAELTPGLSVHSGAGMLGLAFVVSG